MRDYVAAIARKFRKWLLGETRTELRGAHDLWWLSHDLTEPIPTTVASLQPSTLAWIVNDIRINRRQCIVELGAGSSTQIITKLLQKTKDAGDTPLFFSVEENADWIAYVKGILAKDGLDQYVQFIHATRESSGKRGSWYSESILAAALGDRKIDCLIIDGPSIKRVEEATDRERVIPFFLPRMADNYTVFIDDINRPAEKVLMKKWVKQDRPGSTTMNAYVGVLTKGKQYVSRPY